MTFDPPSYPYSGPNPDDARPHDPAARGGGSGGAQSQARRDPVAWAYDPSAQTEHDHHSRVDSPRAADRAATPYAGDQDSYGYGLAPGSRASTNTTPTPSTANRAGLVIIGIRGP